MNKGYSRGTLISKGLFNATPNSRTPLKESKIKLEIWTNGNLETSVCDFWIKYNKGINNFVTSPSFET